VGLSGFVGLMFMAVCGLVPWIDFDLSVPRLDGLVLGVAVFLVLLELLTDQRRLRMVGWLLLLASLMVVVAGLLLTNWPTGGGKGVIVPYWLLPATGTLPYDPTRGVNPNKVAAPLAML